MTKKANRKPGAKPSYRVKSAGFNPLQEAAPKGAKSPADPSFDPRLIDAIGARLLGQQFYFQPGDRIVVIDPKHEGVWGTAWLRGRKATVIQSGPAVPGDHQTLALRFDRRSRRLHNCLGLVDNEFGWWLPSRFCRLISLHRIKIAQGEGK